jgi:hypothetical protein
MKARTFDWSLFLEIGPLLVERFVDLFTDSLCLSFISLASPALLWSFICRRSRQERQGVEIRIKGAAHDNGHGSREQGGRLGSSSSGCHA